MLSEIACAKHNAFHELYRRHGRMVFHFILVRVENRETAEDLHQEVFIRLWETQTGHHPFTQGKAQVSTLLIGITKYVISEHRKKMKTINEGLEKLRLKTKDKSVVQQHSPATDMYYQIAFAELSRPENYRNKEPLPHLAFHLAVYRRRWAGIRTPSGVKSTVDGRAVGGGHQ